MTRFLALLDASNYARSVCEHAAWLAGPDDTVELLHVIGRREGGDEGRRDYSGALGAGARRQLLEELAELDARRSRLGLERGRSILEEGSALVREGGVGTVETALRTGDLIEEVRAREAGADMLLIGKRGEAADFATLHLGSNLDRLARGSALPVFVASRAFRPIAHALIAHDASASAMKAVDAVARMQAFASVRATLLRVGARETGSERSVERARDMLAGAGIAAEIAFADGQPETAIPREANERGADIVVMGAYGHSAIRRLVIGSTTEAVMRAVQLPLLLYR